jgi:predicted GNAT family N-acyltransferase
MAFRVELRDWEAARTIAGPIRYAVFIESENPPAGIELDDDDAQCLHAIAFEEGGAGVGTARLHADGRIGRLVTAKDWRRRGVGEVLLQALIEEARRRGLAAVTVEGSLQAAEFYRTHGFAAEGKVYKDGSALLQKMRLPLA